MSESGGLPPRGRIEAGWHLFAAWHRESRLWREVYVRTLSALIAALVIYAIAVISGLASARPLFFVVAGLLTMSVLTFFYNVARAIPLWRQVKPLLSHWTEHPEPEHVKARAIYTLLTMSGFLSLALALMLWAALMGGH